MRADDIKRLVAQGEGQYLDFKSLFEGPARAKTRDRRAVRDQIAKYVAAFANADGGVLLLGVEDDGRLSGHRYPNEALEAFLQAPASRLTPAGTPGYRVQVDEHELLVFEVEAAPRAVMVAGHGFPRRVGEEVVQEQQESINRLKELVRGQSIESDLAPGGVGLDQLDGELLRRARLGGGMGAASDADYLVARRLAERRGEALMLKRGAVLLFARGPEVLQHPNAGIRILRVDGTDRRTGSRHNVQELPRIEGALPRVVESAHSTLRGLIQRSAKLHDLFFREVPEYPDFAWQEAVVNAVAHRDYRISTFGIEISLFDDRMEVSSPGELLDEVSLDALEKRRRVHASRNPNMARVLTDLGLMREQGEGIPRIFEEMEEVLLPLPEMVEADRRFVLTLRNTPIFDAPDEPWVRTVAKLNLSARQRRALVAFVDKGAFQNRDYCELNRVDRDTAYAEMKELVDRGLLRADGKKYRVVRSVPVEDQPSSERLLAQRLEARGYIQNADYRDAFGVDRREALRGLGELVERGVLVREGERRGARYISGPNYTRWCEEQVPQNGANRGHK